MTFNVTNCNPEQMIIGPTLIQRTTSSAVQNEMDLLQHFREDKNSLFVHTDAFAKSAAVLDKYHLLVITGAPGTGKTFNSRQLLLYLCEEKQCTPFQPTVPDEYLKWCNTRERQAFLMDDVFGASNFNQNDYDAWIKVFPKLMQHLKSLNTYVIFTCRENIFKCHLVGLKATGIFANVINLSDDQFQLTALNKMEMFLCHANKFKIDIKFNELKDSLFQGRDPIGFPQRVHLFCSMENVSKETRLRYFNCPMEFLSTIIGSYRESDHVAYCVLILILLHDGYLPVPFLKHSNKSSEQVQLCLDICQISSSTMGALRNKADSLCGSLLLLNNDRYVYKHPSVMEAVTLDFGQRYPSDVLKNCSLQFILERVFTQNSAPLDNVFVVILQPVMFTQLCERLVKEITRRVDKKDNSLKALSSYAVFNDDTFTRVFLCYLQDKVTIHLLFKSSSPDSPHPTFMFLAAAAGQDAVVHEVLFSHLRYVQRLPGFMEHLDRILYGACCSGSPKIVRMLLTAGARPNNRAAHTPHDVRYGWWYEPPTCTALMHAAYSCNIEVMQLILDRLQQQRVDVASHVGIRDCRGRTALHWWVQGQLGKADTLQILLDAGAYLNVKDTTKQTALHQSARHGNKGAVRELLGAGADVHARDENCQTALHLSAMWSDVAITRLLLKAAADLHVRDEYGQTALHCAAVNVDATVVGALLEDGAYIHATDKHNQSALHRGSQHGNEATIRALLEAGADIHAIDDGGRTALHWSSQRGHEAAIRALVEAGADVHARDKWGHTALHCASEVGDAAVVAGGRS